MATFHKLVEVMSHKQFELIDITSHTKAAVKDSGIKNGMAVIYNPHTTASVRINHNEEMLQQDIMKMLYRTVPVDECDGGRARDFSIFIYGEQ